MSVKVTGLDKALKDIEKKSEAIQKEVIQILSDTASLIEIEAKRNAPERLNGMKESISTKQRITKTFEKGGLYWNVGINATEDIDAYAEFGTGLNAKQILNGKGYSNEMRAIAIKFFKNGQGTLIGKPFLFPAFIRHTANLVEEIKKGIKSVTK